MSQVDKPLVWMEGEIKTPPFSGDARIEAGMLLRRLQRGENIGLAAIPVPCRTLDRVANELRVRDETKNWRIFYHNSADALVILEVHNKTTQKTPPSRPR